MIKKTIQDDTWYSVKYANTKTEVIKADSLNTASLLAYKNAQEQKTILISVKEVKPVKK